MMNLGAIAVLGACVAVLAAAVVGTPSPDEALVRATVLDSVGAVYNVQSERIERSVDPSVVKLGFFRGKNDKDYRPGEKMPYQQLLETAANHNKAGRLPEDAPKEIAVFDVLDKDACAKRTAQCRIDYFHRSKVDGKWKIVQVLWQSAPA